MSAGEVLVFVGVVIGVVIVGPFLLWAALRRTAYYNSPREQDRQSALQSLGRASFGEVALRVAQLTLILIGLAGLYAVAVSGLWAVPLALALSGLWAVLAALEQAIEAAVALIQRYATVLVVLILYFLLRRARGIHTTLAQIHHALQEGRAK